MKISNSRTLTLTLKRKNRSIGGGHYSHTTQPTRLWHRLGAAVVLAAIALAAIAQSAEPVTMLHNIGTGSLTIPATVTTAPVNYLVYGTTITNSITVQPGFTGDLILKDVNITYAQAQWKNAINLQAGATLKLKLMGTTNIQSATAGTVDNAKAVIRVDNTATLIIESYDGTVTGGVLNVQQAFGGSTGLGGAAIGSDNGTHNGTIIINSGTVNARGGDDCAGIGGGSHGAGGYITINGGKVIGNCDSHQGGGNSGAGIGAGYACTDTRTFIRINGGDVTAISLLKPTLPSSGSAIGTGNNCGGFGYIIIAGGTVRASIRSLFNDAGQPVHPDDQSRVLIYDDEKSGLDGLKYQTGYTGPYGATPPEGYRGDGGCGIGGGASSTASGLIIILPSANVQRIYGGVNTNNKDIGNCSQLYYLNKTPLRVGLAAAATPVVTKNFTIRTGEFKPNVDMYVHVPAADNYLSSVAAHIGATQGASGAAILGKNQSAPANGTPDALRYYTNLEANYFTGATPSSPSQAYSVMNIAAASAGTNPNAGQSYNPDANNPFNVVLTASAISSSFHLSQGWSAIPSVPPGVLAYNKTEETLDFGTATYDRNGPQFATRTQMKVGIKNTGTQWLKVTVDPSSNIRYFDLTGAVVSHPEVTDGANLPVGTNGVITATLRNKVSVGNLCDTLVLKATQPNGTVITRTVYLKISVSQKLVIADTEAWLKSKNLQTNDKTNSTVRLNAHAVAADVDGVYRVWYKIDANATDPEESSTVLGFTPIGSGWTVVDATPGADGRYGYNFLVGDCPFPSTSGVHLYYVHWFVETVNTVGSRGGTLGPFEYCADPLTATISGPASIGAGAPAELTIHFGNQALSPTFQPDEGMFSVTNGVIVPGSLTTTVADHTYTLKVQASSATDVTVQFPANNVRDAYSNRNQVSNTFTLSYETGIPRANFSTLDSAYFAPPSNLVFTVARGISTSGLYLSDGITTVNSGNANQTFLLNNAVPTGFTYTEPLLDVYTYTLTGPLSAGEYVIRFPTAGVRNALGNPIVDTTHVFRVFNLSLSAGLVTFPTRNEGYPAFFHPLILTNNGGSPALKGLEVRITGADAADFVCNTPPATLPAGVSATTLNVGPRAGLLKRSLAYTASLDIWAEGRLVLSVPLSFRVDKWPAPNAKIDYLRETLYNLDADSTYVFGSGLPARPFAGVDRVAPDKAGEYSIPENWMNDAALSIQAYDTVYGAPGEAQLLVIPRRPPAPQLRWQNTTSVQANNGMIIGVTDSMEYRVGNSDEWISVPPYTDELSLLPQGIYYVRKKAVEGKSFCGYVTTVVITADLPSNILREIILPAAPTGVTILPASGVHRVHTGTDFAFTLLYPGSTPPVVKTSRILDGVQEELKATAAGPGRWDYVIPRVSEAMMIAISFSEANVAADGRNVWAFGGVIYLETPAPATVDVYTTTGVLLHRLHAPAGQTSVHAAPGVYIVTWPDGSTHKVVVQ